MGKKTIILSQKQINEICGDNYTYFDNMASAPDKEIDFANNITVGGNISNGYVFPYKTDDISKEMTKRNWGYNMYNKRGATSLNEYTEFTKKELHEKHVKEGFDPLKKKEHGNKALNNRKFGKRGYSAAKQSNYRLKKAENEYKYAINTKDNEGALRALRTLGQMKKNGTANSGEKYEDARNAQNLITQPNIVSKTKEKSTSQISTPKDGVFTS
jgi:hypothetical protein